MTRDEKYRQTRARNRAYRTRRALGIIRRIQPKTVEEARTALGMACVEVGQGAFRTAYRVHGTNLLIKFPIMFNYPTHEGDNWHDREGKNHTRMEVKKIRALLAYPMMAKHLPPIYYFNGRDGVMVTRYYPELQGVASATNRLVSEMFKEFCGVVMGDTSSDNLRTNGRGVWNKLIFIDCGY
jgi:hypothetical protein